MNLQYHRCPDCGFIMESREGDQYRLGQYFKDLKCNRCGHEFRLYKKDHPGVTPIFGSPQPTEVDWIDRRKR